MQAGYQLCALNYTTCPNRIIKASQMPGATLAKALYKGIWLGLLRSCPKTYIFRTFWPCFLTLFLHISVTDLSRKFWTGRLSRKIMLMLEFSKTPFLFLLFSLFSGNTLVILLILLSVIVLLLVLMGMLVKTLLKQLMQDW